jgi:hypothetical protein
MKFRMQYLWWRLWTAVGSKKAKKRVYYKTYGDPVMGHSYSEEAWLVHLELQRRLKEQGCRGEEGK